jgi:hypothetical protein
MVEMPGLPRRTRGHLFMRKSLQRIQKEDSMTSDDIQQSKGNQQQIDDRAGNVENSPWLAENLDRLQQSGTE